MARVRCQRCRRYVEVEHHDGEVVLAWASEQRVSDMSYWASHRPVEQHPMAQ